MTSCTENNWTYLGGFVFNTRVWRQFRNKNLIIGVALFSNPFLLRGLPELGMPLLRTPLSQPLPGKLEANHPQFDEIRPQPEIILPFAKQYTIVG